MDKQNWEAYEAAREQAYRRAMDLASAVCYGTTPEHLEQLKAEFLDADKAFRMALGITQPSTRA